MSDDVKYEVCSSKAFWLLFVEGFVLRSFIFGGWTRERIGEKGDILKYFHSQFKIWW